MPVGGANLTAQWNRSAYEVRFMIGVNGTSSDELVQLVAYEGNATAPVITPNSGWTFMGWNNSFSSITGPITIYANYRKDELEGSSEDTVTEDGERIVKITPDEDYLIQDLKINGEEVTLDNRNEYENDTFALDDEVSVTYVKRIESVLVYKGVEHGVNIGDELTIKEKNKYFLLLSFDQYDELYKTKLIKVWIDENKLKQKQVFDLNLSILNAMGKNEWGSIAQFDDEGTLISMLSGKRKEKELGQDQTGEAIRDTVASYLKGDLIYANETGFKQLKRKWKLNRFITKEANSFTPKKLIKENLEELPNLNDVVNYLLEVQLIKFEISENE